MSEELCWEVWEEGHEGGERWVLVAAFREEAHAVAFAAPEPLRRAVYRSVERWQHGPEYRTVFSRWG
jgi:hypothetical protein